MPLLLPLALGCAKLCYMMIVYSGLTLDFEAPITDPVEWVFVVTDTTTGESATCAHTVGTSDPDTADTADTAAVPCVVDAGRPTASASLRLDPDTGAITGLQLIELVPATLTLHVTRDGVDYADHTLTPDYDVSEPTGEGCGEVFHATVAVALP